MASVAEFLETAAEFDRQAAEAKRPSQKLHCLSMAKAYRFLAEQQAIVDEQVASNAQPQAATLSQSRRLPSMRRNVRRRSGAVTTGSLGSVASAASTRSPTGHTRSAMPCATAGDATEM